MFKTIYSIEIQPTLAQIATDRFKHFEHIKIIHGDSALKLSEIIPDKTTRSLIWLDGHYSGGMTGRGVQDCPVWQELEAIARLWGPAASIYIDDARCFGTDPAYPSVDALVQFARAKFPSHCFSIENDMIMIKCNLRI